MRLVDGEPFGRRSGSDRSRDVGRSQKFRSRYAKSRDHAYIGENADRDRTQFGEPGTQQRIHARTPQEVVFAGFLA
jgi:hypothetical protein